jgi:hypothetical protein
MSLNNQYNFDVIQDSNFNFAINATNNDGSYINLSGFGITGIITSSFSNSEILYNINPTIDSSYISGLMLISGNVGKIPVGQYPYSIDIFSDNYYLNILGGYWNIYPSVI